MATRSGYDTYLSALQQAMRQGAQVPSYEATVNQLVSTYGGTVSPQEIGDTVYNMYASAGPAPSARYYGANPGTSSTKYSNTGGYSSGGGSYSAPAYNPDTDPNLLNPVKAQLSQKIAAINALYDALYGDLGTLYQSKRSELDTNLAEERDKSQKAYEETARILPTQYAAQGIRYSSYYENADKKAGDNYNEGLSALQKSYDQNLGQLGSAYNQQKTAFDVGRNQLGQINPAAYGSVSQAQGSLQNLNSLEGQLAQQRAGLGTNSQYIQSLNQIAPAKSTVPDALKKQLEELSSASIPGSAKTTIANGIIRQAGTGQDTYWTDYFNKLLSGQGQTANPLG